MSDNRQTGPDDLDRRIAAAQAADRARGSVDAHRPAKGYGQGARVLAELIGAPLGGALIGWLLDRWFGTAPWLLLILLVLAIVVAGRNIYRISQERAQ